MKYNVIAECVDVRDGKRYFPGDTFPDPDADQAKRLVASGSVEEVKSQPASNARGASSKP